jgi:hypothetical protein
MASTYSPSLRLELIGAGEQAGTWNTTTNTNLGALLDQAIAGYQTVSVTSASQAFTALDGATDQARNAVIQLTTTTTAAFAVYAPPQKKTYIIDNSTAYATTIYNSTVLGNTTAAGLGVSISAGSKVVVFSDGTNFYSLSISSLSGTLAVVNGGTGVTSSTGTGSVVLSNSPTLVTPALGTPSSGTVTNLTGTASININGTVGATTANTGAFSSVVVSGLMTSGSVSTTGCSASTFTAGTSGTFPIAYVGSASSGSFFFLGTTSIVPGVASKATVVFDSSNEQGLTLKTSSTTYNGNPIIFVNDVNGTSGSIYQTLSAVAYLTSSDYRLKNSIAPMTGALDKVALLKPCTYKWNIDGADGQGFIAHELGEVVPDCTSGEKDAFNKDGSIKPQGVDPSKLVATLTAAIQELKALVDAQAVRIATLEAA